MGDNDGDNTGFLDIDQYKEEVKITFCEDSVNQKRRGVTY